MEVSSNTSCREELLNAELSVPLADSTANELLMTWRSLNNIEWETSQVNICGFSGEARARELTFICVPHFTASKVLGDFLTSPVGLPCGGVYCASSGKARISAITRINNETFRYLWNNTRIVSNIIEDALRNRVSSLASIDADIAHMFKTLDYLPAFTTPREYRWRRLRKDQQAEVNLIIGLLLPEQIILLENPFEDLRTQSMKLLLESLKKFSAQGHAIIIISSRFPENVISASDYVYLLHKSGVCVFEGKSDYLRKVLPSTTSSAVEQSLRIFVCNNVRSSLTLQSPSIIPTTSPTAAIKSTGKQKAMANPDLKFIRIIFLENVFLLRRIIYMILQILLAIFHHVSESNPGQASCLKAFSSRKNGSFICLWILISIFISIESGFKLGQRYYPYVRNIYAGNSYRIKFIFWPFQHASILIEAIAVLLPSFLLSSLYYQDLQISSGFGIILFIMLNFLHNLLYHHIGAILSQTSCADKLILSVIFISIFPCFASVFDDRGSSSFTLIFLWISPSYHIFKVMILILYIAPFKLFCPGECHDRFFESEVFASYMRYLPSAKDVKQTVVNRLFHSMNLNVSATSICQPAGVSVSLYLIFPLWLTFAIAVASHMIFVESLS